MASIWEQYGFNGQFLQPTYMGLVQGTYKSLPHIPYKPHIGKNICTWNILII